VERRDGERGAHGGRRVGRRVRGAFGRVGEHVARPLLLLIGWAGAVFLPFAPAVHALRRLGRLGCARGPRLAGVPRRVCRAGARARGARLGVGRAESAAAGVWGGFVAFYLREGFGLAGAWAARRVRRVRRWPRGTLAWNPVRAVLAGRSLVGGGAATPPDGQERGADRSPEWDAASDGEGAAPRRTRRRAPVPADLAVALEPPPEEMPAADPTLLAEVAGCRPSRGRAQSPSPRQRTSVPAAAAAARAPRSAPTGRPPWRRAGARRCRRPTRCGRVGAERPPRHLLAEAPARNVEVNRRELDGAAQRLEEVLARSGSTGRSRGAPWARR
jgi:hypothetical protein